MNSVRASIRASQPNTLAGTITTEGDLSGTISGNVSVVINSGGPFEITLTADENGKYTSDKTGKEILSAYNEGKRMVCNVSSHVVSTSWHQIPLIACMAMNVTPILVFHSTNKLQYQNVVIRLTKNGPIISSITVTSGEYSPKNSSLYINDQIYDGSEDITIDTRDFIFNITCVDEENGVFEVDTTAEDFLNAFNAGRTMVMVYEGLRCQFMGANEEGCIFYLDVAGSFVLLAVVSIIDGAISVYVNIVTTEITIGEQNWSGVGTINFTDEINKMIDNKTITDEELALLKITLI